MTNQYDHNGRIKQLENKVERLFGIVEAAGLTEEFIVLSQAAKILKINSWVIRDRIKNDAAVKLNRHYKMNGNRYLVNVEAWQNLIASDAKAKQN